MPGRLLAVTIDCPDPRALAAFYATLLDLELIEVDDPYVVIGTADRRPVLTFQEVDDYRPPTWPGPERRAHAHLDVEVDDLDVAQAEVLAAGARLLEGSDRPIGYRVFADPAGHPFCLVTPEGFGAG